MMRNLLRVFRLVFGGLCVASSAFALEEYSGPAEVAAVNIAKSVGGGCAASTGNTSFAAVIAAAGVCGFEAYVICKGSTGGGLPCTSSGGTICTDTGNVAGCGLMGLSGGYWYVGLGSLTAGYTCGSNRLLRNVAGSQTCVSMCYDLRGAMVTAFVPIDDPAQNVPGACLFVSGSGMCELEVVDTSNFTYGSQLYRGGTWAHVGQRCTEDASSPPDDGALSQGPTGGTGGGSSSTSGPSSAETTAGGEALAGGELGRTTSESQGDLLTSMVATPEALPKPGWEDRWNLSLASFLGVEAAACNAFPGITVMGQTYTLDVCPWLHYWESFAKWMVYLYTAFALWNLLYSRPGGA